jgi:hypothetical protein
MAYINKSFTFLKLAYVHNVLHKIMKALFEWIKRVMNEMEIIDS